MQAPSPQHFLYFAYGSNLLTQRLRERTPSALKVATGTLHRHELRWHKAGSDGSGKCDVIESPNAASVVYGVVYQIHLSEKSVLDAAESLGVGYAEKKSQIISKSGEFEATLYFALEVDPSATPYDWYHYLVVAGAREHGFPQHYLRALETVRSKVDSDEARAKRHFSLVASAA